MKSFEQFSPNLQAVTTAASLEGGILEETLRLVDEEIRVLK